jgi:hypothetical protein
VELWWFVGGWLVGLVVEDFVGGVVIVWGGLGVVLLDVVGVVDGVLCEGGVCFG